MTVTIQRPTIRCCGPIEAARAAASYLDFDPCFFLDQAALAGMCLMTDGKLIHHLAQTDGDHQRVEFLSRWMRIGGGGKALRSLMIKRGLVD